MGWRVGLAAAIVLAGVAPAAAGDRPLFDFRGHLPIPGGMVWLEARCEDGGESVSCRAEGRGPSGRGFQAEGRFFLAPRAPDVSPGPKPAPNLHQWF